MSTEPRRLYRDRRNRMIGGVCSGLGKYFGVDPTVLRILFVLGVLLAGHGLLIYLVLLILMPEEPLSPPASSG